MNQGINGSMTHGLIDGEGSGHMGNVPWVDGVNENGNHLGGGGGPQVLAARCLGWSPENPRTL